MPTTSKCSTTGCGGDPDVPGAAGGRCPRCYQWVRRHPNGPAPSPAPKADGSRDAQLSVRCSRKLKRAAMAVAKKNGITVSTMLENYLILRTGGVR